LIEPLAKPVQFVRGDDAVPRQQVEGIGLVAGFHAVAGRIGGDLLQMAEAACEEIVGDGISGFPGFGQEMHRVDRGEIEPEIASDVPETDRTLIVLAGGEDFDDGGDSLFPLGAGRADVAIGIENGEGDAPAAELLRAEVGIVVEVGEESAGKAEGNGRIGRFQFPEPGIERAIQRHLFLLTFEDAALHRRAVGQGRADAEMGSVAGGLLS